MAIRACKRCRKQSAQIEMTIVLAEYLIVGWCGSHGKNFVHRKGFPLGTQKLQSWKFCKYKKLLSVCPSVQFSGVPGCSFYRLNLTTKTIRTKPGSQRGSCSQNIMSQTLRTRCVHALLPKISHGATLFQYLSIRNLMDMTC